MILVLDECNPSNVGKISAATLIGWVVAQLLVVVVVVLDVQELLYESGTTKRKNKPRREMKQSQRKRQHRA